MPHPPKEPFPFALLFVCKADETELGYENRQEPELCNEQQKCDLSKLWYTVSVKYTKISKTYNQKENINNSD